MSNTIGTLVTALTADYGPLENGLKMSNRLHKTYVDEVKRGSIAIRDAQAVRGYQDVMRQTSQEMNGAFGTTQRLTFATAELGRAVEDAAVSYGVNGLQGAIRGAGNNISAMFMMMNPLLGTIASFAVAGVSLFMSYLKAAEGAKILAENTEKARAALDKTTDAIERQVKAQQAMRDIAEALRKGEKTGDAVAEFKRRSDELEIIRTQLNAMRAAQAAAAHELKKTKQGEAEAEYREGWSVSAASERERAELRAKRERLEAEIAEREKLERELAAKLDELTRQREEWRKLSIEDRAKMEIEADKALRKQQAEEAEKRIQEEQQRRHQERVDAERAEREQRVARDKELREQMKRMKLDEKVLHGMNLEAAPDLIMAGSKQAYELGVKSMNQDNNPVRAIQLASNAQIQKLQEIVAELQALRRGDGETVTEVDF